MMLKNYFKIAIRVLRRAKLYSAINTAGLTLGLAAAILIGLWVRYELSYDTYNANADRIYRVTTHFKMGEFGQTMATSAPPIEDALQNLPSVEAATSLKFGSSKVVIGNGASAFVEDRLAYGDSNFFNVFTIPLVEGNPLNALTAPGTIVLTQSMAKLLFGSNDPLGKSVIISEGSWKESFEVTGVMEDVPENSHFHFPFLVSLSTYYRDAKGVQTKWFYNTNYNYFVVRPGTKAGTVIGQLSAAVQQNLGKAFVTRYSWGVGAQKLTDIHLHSHLALEIEPNGSMRSVIVLMIIGLFILLVAVVNFVSLSTARYADRAKEVRVRKVIGADRRLLFFQFTGEAAILTFLSSILAVSIAEIVLPYFNVFTGSSLKIGPGELVAILMGGSIVGLISGIYPAFFLSSLQVNRILKRDLFLRRGKGYFRKWLVVSQFVLAIGIMAVTFVIARQMDFLNGRNPGFDKQDVVVIPLYNQELSDDYSNLRNELASVPGVIDVSGSGGEFGDARWNNELEYNGRILFKANWLWVDYGFLKTMKIRTVSGRDFSKSIASDASGAIIVNQSAADKLRQLGLLDKTLSPGVQTVGDSALHVVGVAKDFNYLSAYNPVEPFFFVLEPGNVHYVYVRIAPGGITSTLQDLGRVWSKVVPNNPFEYHFLSNQLEHSYTSDRKLGDVFKVAAFLSVFISVLGLFGLASYSAEKRTREIAIRKALGASVREITFTVAKEFGILVLAASMVASPIAYYYSESWLKNFAYRIDVTALPFLLAAGIAVGVSLLVVGVRAVRAAAANPVESLRYE